MVLNFNKKNGLVPSTSTKVKKGTTQHTKNHY